MLQTSHKNSTQLTSLITILRFIAFSHAFPGQSLRNPSAAAPEHTPKLGAYVRRFVIQIRLNEKDVRRVDNLDLGHYSLHSIPSPAWKEPIVHHYRDYLPEARMYPEVLHP
jgi:hypothetical protein